MAKGKKFIGLVLTERQAKSLHAYASMMEQHGAGRDVARDMRAIRVKVGKSLAKLNLTARGDKV